MERNKLDVVYALGTGSNWNNNEIRFSLRSIQKNLGNFRKVFIVGERPEFLKNIIHIPAMDIFNPGKNADGNIITKVLEACKHPELSENFLFINDDHLVIKPIEISQVPPLHKGDMNTFPQSYWKLNFWRKRLKRTRDILNEKELTALHFDCHTPILFNKNRFPEIMRQFDYKSDIGYTMKSLYGNSQYIAAPLLTNQKKTIFKNYPLNEIEHRLAVPTFMSFNDEGLNNHLKWWLISNFPRQSAFEKDSPGDKVFDFYFWKLQGEPYELGVEIFQRYFKHQHLINLFKSGKTPVLQKKLNYKLNKYMTTL